MSKQSIPDLTFTRSGGMVVVYVNTQAAALWVADNVDVPDWAWLGASSSVFAADARLAYGLACGAASDGLTLGDN